MIVLDTHAWIWWVSDPKKLGKKAARALKATKRIGVPAISTWELAMLTAEGRIKLDRPALDWIQTALAEPRVELLPMTPAIAVQATRLGAGFHSDPADGLIVATAQLEAAPLVTKDQRILEYSGVETIWD